MRPVLTTLLIGSTLALAPPAAAQAAGAQAVIAPSAIAPVDRPEEPWWTQRHLDLLATLAEHQDAQVVLIGDSITNNYDKAKLPDENFQPTWQQFYAPRHAINLGFSGDATNNVLWRLQHGEVAGLSPKVAILLIGTNDTGWKNRSAAQTQAGIDAVVADLKTRLPRTKILLLGILPSDLSPEKSAKDAAVNRHLAATYAQDGRVTYLDIGGIFRRPDGTLDIATFYDPRLAVPGKALHPDSNGQRRMAEAIEPTLAHMLGDAARE